MGSFISWIDYSEAERQRVRDVMKMFGSPGTIDDLGIGTIRDAFSDTLFPGTSTVQSRARYFLFVPWIYRRAEQRRSGGIEAWGQARERKLVEALRRGGDHNGLIGVQAGGAKLKILPSAIYWTGLARFGIFHRGDLTLHQYAREAAAQRPAEDQEDEIGERHPGFWCSEQPEPPDEFFDFDACRFELSLGEAEWLAEKMVSPTAVAGTEVRPLLVDLVRSVQQGEVAPDPDTLVWSAELPASVPALTREVVEHAEMFSKAVQGAALLYNLVLAEQRSALTDRDDTLDSSELVEPAFYFRALDDWADDDIDRLTDWARQTGEFVECVHQIRGSRSQHALAFVTSWMDVLADGPEAARRPNARALITGRERQQKRALARIDNPKRLLDWAGQSGTDRLAFRWDTVCVLLEDLASGLGQPGEGPVDAVA